MRPTVRPQSTPCRFRFTLSQTRTISAKRAEVHQNLSRRPSPHGTATRRWPVKCRRGHHGVQTRGARAAYHGIEDERHARLRALSRSVGTADRCAVTGRCRLLANRAVSRGADWPGQRTAAQVRPAADQERRRPGRHLRRFSLGLRQRGPTTVTLFVEVPSASHSVAAHADTAGLDVQG